MPERRAAKTGGTTSLVREHGRRNKVTMWHGGQSTKKKRADANVQIERDETGGDAQGEKEPVDAKNCVWELACRLRLRFIFSTSFGFDTCGRPCIGKGEDDDTIQISPLSARDAFASGRGRTIEMGQEAGTTGSRPERAQRVIGVKREGAGQHTGHSFLRLVLTIPFLTLSSLSTVPHR
ncbi:hypothetical protein MRX96_008340 [Rhipicephalus microplus]